MHIHEEHKLQVANVSDEHLSVYEDSSTPFRRGKVTVYPCLLKHVLFLL